MESFSSRTPLCVCACVCVGACVCVCACTCTHPTHSTRKNSKRKLRVSEEKHPICSNFVWAVPVSKYCGNIFWSKDQRTYGLTHGLTKGKKYWKLGPSGKVWDVWLQSFSEHLGIMEFFGKHFEILTHYIPFSKLGVILSTESQTVLSTVSVIPLITGSVIPKLSCPWQ